MTDGPLTDTTPRYFSKETGGTTLQALHAFLETLARFSVRRYECILDGDPVVVEFFPQEPKPIAPGPLQPADTAMKDVCECGHAIADHSEEGLCLHACEAKKCSL